MTLLNFSSNIIPSITLFCSQLQLINLQVLDSDLIEHKLLDFTPLYKALSALLANYFQTSYKIPLYKALSALLAKPHTNNLTKTIQVPI